MLVLLSYFGRTNLLLYVMLTLTLVPLVIKYKHNWVAILCFKVQFGVL